MLERVVTWIPSPVMGDMQVEIRYTDWKDIGNGIKAPFHIHMHQGDHPLVRGMNFMDVQASDVKANIESASLTVPDAVRHRGGSEGQCSEHKARRWRVAARRRFA